jgi:hypothetical protein
MAEYELWEGHSKYKVVHKFHQKDKRDYVFQCKIHKSSRVINTIIRNNKYNYTYINLPSIFTLSNLPDIVDQGELGDCVANSWYYYLMFKTESEVPLSRLFLYANCRCIDNCPLEKDIGTTVRTACKALSRYGICSEIDYPYEISTFKNLPPLSAYKNSKLLKNFEYIFLSECKKNSTSILTCLKSSLVTNNLPIVFGIMLFSSFMTKSVARTGIIPMPNTKTENNVGGHCICIVGYNDTVQYFKCANSWGTSWGDNGYFYLPYEYVSNPSLAGDFCFANFDYMGK